MGCEEKNIVFLQLITSLDPTPLAIFSFFYPFSVMLKLGLIRINDDSSSDAAVKEPNLEHLFDVFVFYLMG